VPFDGCWSQTYLDPTTEQVDVAALREALREKLSIDFDALSPRMRLADIVRDPKRPLRGGVVNCSARMFLYRVEAGTYPKPLKYAPRMATWDRRDIARIALWELAKAEEASFPPVPSPREKKNAASQKPAPSAKRPVVKAPQPAAARQRKPASREVERHLS
jgi:hypothetical protein